MSTTRLDGSDSESRPSSARRSKTSASVTSRRNGHSQPRGNHITKSVSEERIAEYKAAFVAAVKGASTNGVLRSKSELLLGKYSVDDQVTLPLY